MSALHGCEPHMQSEKQLTLHKSKAKYCFWGLYLHIPTGTLPLNSAGDFRSPDPLATKSNYAPRGADTNDMTGEAFDAGTYVTCSLGVLFKIVF